MTQQDKELLLIDLCARLPYKPICFKRVTNCTPGNSVLLEEDVYSFRTGKPTEQDYGQHDYYKTIILELKPYLRSMSSMTQAEKKYLNNLRNIKFDTYYGYHAACINYLNSIHVDYNDLIGKGLAIEVTKENNPYV